MESGKAGSKRVLIVEDEPLIRLILAESLTDVGYTVVQAVDGDEATRLIDGPDGFHAVITDIHMPGGRNGIVVGRHARKRDPGIPIVYVTGRPEALQEAGPLGPNDALVRKPYRPSEIMGALEKVMPDED